MPGFDIFYSLIILKSAAGKLPKRITVMPDSHIITRQVNYKLTYIGYSPVIAKFFWSKHFGNILYSRLREFLVRILGILPMIENAHIENFSGQPYIFRTNKTISLVRGDVNHVVIQHQSHQIFEFTCQARSMHKPFENWMQFFFVEFAPSSLPKLQNSWSNTYQDGDMLKKILDCSNKQIFLFAIFAIIKHR